MADMNQLLKEAFELLAREEYENRSEVPKHKFSLRFHWNIHQIFWSAGATEKRKTTEKNTPFECYRPIRSRRKRIVFVCLMFAIVGGTVFAAEPVIRWLHNYYMKQHEDHVEIQKSEIDEGNTGSSNQEFRKYRLTKLPEGYSFQKEIFNEEFQKYLIYYYSGKEEKILYLQQTFVDGETPGNITSDTEPIERIKIKDFVGYYTEDNKMGTLVLTDEVYMLVIHGELSKEALLELAEGLQLVENP